MARTQSDKRWQFLRQWWWAMRPVATPIIAGVVSETSQRCGYGPMRIVPPYGAARAEEEWSTMRDALELLSLFSLVDAPAFLSMMRDASIQADSSFPQRKERAAGVCGVGARAQDAGERLHSPGGNRLFPESPWAATAIFETLVSLKSQMLYVQAESSKRLEEARRVAMRVFPFRLANVTIGANDGTLSPSFMTTVHNHVMSGVVTVGDVVLRSSDGRSLGDSDRQKFAVFVTAVCAPNGPAVVHDAVRRSGKNMVQLEASMGLTPFVQFCSALTYSTGVEELVVDDMLNVHHSMSRRQRWAVLLYAVFSAEASNDIQCLGLGDFEITEGDLAWMRALFEAHDAIERLLLYALADDSLPTDLETPSSRIVVRSGATIQSCQGFSPLFDVETRKELTFYGYRSCGSGMEVIAPAFGNTIVPGSHILRTEPIDGATHKWWNLDSHKIKSLYIRSYGDESDPEYEQCMRNLASFIGIIGRPLETLGLLCDLPRPELFLSMVWPTCTNPKKLIMYDPSFQTLQYLIDSYESGECRIESLRLEEVRLAEASSLEVFAKTLADPTSKMARTLVELQFMLAEDSEIFAPTGQHCVALANALSTNETLQYLSINVQIDDYADVKPLYEKLHNSWIPGSTTRTVFPLRSKCAFISVVEKMNDPNETSSNHAAAVSIAQLDSRVLSLIFEMAGTPRRRTVILLPSY